MLAIPTSLQHYTGFPSQYVKAYLNYVKTRNEKTNFSLFAFCMIVFIKISKYLHKNPTVYKLKHLENVMVKDEIYDSNKKVPNNKANKYIKVCYNKHNNIFSLWRKL